MKIKAIRPVMVIVLLLLLVSPVASQVPDDKLIVPGQRIGRWTLTMTIADLTQMNGATNQVGPGAGQDLARENLVHRWDRLGFVAVTSKSDPQRPEALVAISDEFKTEKGIGVNSRREAVEAAYLRPTAETAVTAAIRRLFYDEIGLGVRTLVSVGLVESVFVFRPGTAKQLWKY
jgi:hypothetical protein